MARRLRRHCSRCALDLPRANHDTTRALNSHKMAPLKEGQAVWVMDSAIAKDNLYNIGHLVAIDHANGKVTVETAEPVTGTVTVDVDSSEPSGEFY